MVPYYEYPRHKPVVRVPWSIFLLYGCGGCAVYFVFTVVRFCSSKSCKYGTIWLASGSATMEQYSTEQLLPVGVSLPTIGTLLSSISMLIRSLSVSSSPAPPVQSLGLPPGGPAPGPARSCWRVQARPTADERLYICMLSLVRSLLITLTAFTGRRRLRFCGPSSRLTCRGLHVSEQVVLVVACSPRRHYCTVPVELGYSYRRALVGGSRGRARKTKTGGPEN